MPLPEYLILNRERIANLPPQEGFAWSARHTDITTSFNYGPMQRLRTRFPNRTLTRNSVATLFRHEIESDPAICILAAMLWGGINVTRPNRLTGITNFEAFIRAGEDHHKNCLANLIPVLKKGELETAFELFSRNGQCHTVGIGSSYFTKVFYFAGHALGISPTPLILDKWTIHGFGTLLKQGTPPEDHNTLKKIQQLFTAELLKSERVAAQTIAFRTAPQATTYQLFVKTFNDWAAKLDVSPTQLEQFIFGHDYRTKLGRAPDNPRAELSECARIMFETRA